MGIMFPTLMWRSSMSAHAIETQSPLVFTEAAARKVKQLIDEEGDTAVEQCGVTLLIDPMSFQYLVGAEIDYSEGLQGEQFVIRNPNASTTCGCGSSFSV